MKSEIRIAGFGAFLGLATLLWCQFSSAQTAPLYQPINENAGTAGLFGQQQPAAQKDLRSEMVKELIADLNARKQKIRELELKVERLREELQDRQRKYEAIMDLEHKKQGGMPPAVQKQARGIDFTGDAKRGALKSQEPGSAGIQFLRDAARGP